jgi:hypothetical protein
VFGSFKLNLRDYGLGQHPKPPNPNCTDRARDEGIISAWRIAHRVAMSITDKVTRQRAVLRIVGACLATVILLLPAMSAITAESKRVLLLHSFGRELKPWSEYAETIRWELDSQSPWPLDITDQSLVTARASSENEVPFVEYLRSLYANRTTEHQSSSWSL